MRFRLFLPRILPRSLFCLALLLAAGAAAPAQAQNFSRYSQTARQEPEPPHRSFWNRLFGRHKQYEAARPAPPAPPRAAPPKATVKNKNARHVLVIGDAMAAALAEGLSASYNDNPNIVIRAKTGTASGLLHPASLDRPANNRPPAAGEKPDLIIIMPGMNDGQPPAGNQAAAPAAQTQMPGKAYQAQLPALLPALQKNHAAWVWAGLPPFKDPELNSKAQALNRLYRQAAENAGGRFVSIWHG